MERGREALALQGLTAVDGSVLRALPQMAWALWMDDQHRDTKLHLHFEVLKGVPVDAILTPAACSEPDQLRAMLQPGRLYVTDRGYADYQLFRDILDAGSSFVARLRTTPPSPWPKNDPAPVGPRSRRPPRCRSRPAGH